MGLSTIDAGMAKKAFLAGAKELEAKKEWINELNVFPVPDGDTGTNMTMTVMAAAREVAALEDPSMRDLARAISSGSLRGARGNSGVILSQLFRGFTKEIQDAEIIDADVLARAMARGTETAYKAVTKAKEGTIITKDKRRDDPHRGQGHVGQSAGALFGGRGYGSPCSGGDRGGRSGT